MYTLIKLFHLAFNMVEVFLHVSEQSSGSGEGGCHRAQLAQDPLSLN